MEPAGSGAQRRRTSERALLRGEVGVEVDLGGLDRLVTQPERYHGAIVAGLEQRHSGGVAQDVRRDGLAADRRAAAARVVRILGDEALDGITAEPGVAPTRKRGRAG